MAQITDDYYHMIDQEALDYIAESHRTQLLQGGEPVYLFRRKSSGSSVSLTTITSWDETEDYYAKTIWESGLNHPDLRFWSNDSQVGIRVFIDGVEQTRLDGERDELQPGEFVVEVGTDKSVKVVLPEGYVPTGTVEYSYTTRCVCTDPDRHEPHMQCEICYGTGWEGGYDLYTCDATDYTDENQILVRFPKVEEDLQINPEGLVIERATRHWALPEPRINDRDLIVGTTGNNKNIIFRVKNWNDSRLRGVLLHQEFDTDRLNFTDVVYKLLDLI